MRTESIGSPWSHSSTSTRSRPNAVDQALELATGRRGPSSTSAAGTGSLAAPGEHPAHTAHLVGDVGERELWRALLPRQLPETDRPGEPGVPGRAVGEHEQVPAVRVGGVGVGQLAGVDLEQRVALGAGDVLLVAEPGVRVISAPNTVGSPTARAASAKRTTP